MPDVYMPRSLDELLDLKAAHDSLYVFAGGTDLMVSMRCGRTRPAALACLDRLDAIRGISDAGTYISVGAGESHSSLLKSPLIRKHAPVLAEALDTLGSPHIRNTGTLGGNIVTASPAGDSLPPLTILDAQVELAGKDGFRRMPLADFIVGPGVVRLEKDRILWKVLIPKTPYYGIHHFEKVGLRRSMAIAVVSMAAVLDLSPDGIVKAIRMAWGSVGPTVVACPEAENGMVGKRLEPDALALAADAVRERVRPIDDVRATAEYRRQVAGNLVLRLARYAPAVSGECPP